MNKKNYNGICILISKISPYIRFVGIVGICGELLASYRRHKLKPLLNSKNMNYQFTNIAIQTNLESIFDKSLGSIEFIWEERKKVQIISFAIKNKRIWISID